MGAHEPARLVRFLVSCVHGLDPGGCRRAGQRHGRIVEFYRDKVGFDLDHDTANEYMHVVQLTPRGSGCSIVIGNLPSQNEMAPGLP